MATVVVTGASGFLGSFLTAFLKNRGLTVIPVSRRPLAGTYQVEDYSRSPAGDVLVHLAEDPDAGRVSQLGETYFVSVTRVVKALSRGSYQRIIYASSGMVYGDQCECPCRVDMPALATDMYTNSKLANERIVLDSGGVVLRLSNLIGIGMAANNVMSEILRQVPGIGPVRVRDDRPVRDFLPMPEAASAFSLAIESDFIGIANVGSGIGTSVKALAELALAAVGQGGREIRATKPSSRRSINVLDISATRRILGWSPASSLKDQMDQLLCNRAESGDAKT